jgi:hypothetical protein
MKSYFSIEQALKDVSIDIGKLSAEIEARAKASMQALAAQTHGLILEKTNKLRSTRDLYIQNLVMTNEGHNIWIVGLKSEAGWIEDGQKSGYMHDRLLNGGKPAKVSKEGNKYKSIPFKHSGPGSKMSKTQLSIATYAKNELKRQGLDKPIIMNGKPVIGKVATIRTLAGADQPTNKFGNPILAGMTVYQRKGGGGKMTKDIFTYRTISEKTKGDGSWFHPGTDGLKAFEEVEKQVEEMWSKIVEDIVKNVKIQNG